MKFSHWNPGIVPYVKTTAGFWHVIACHTPPIQLCLVYYKFITIWMSTMSTGKLKIFVKNGIKLEQLKNNITASKVSIIINPNVKLFWPFQTRAWLGWQTWMRCTWPPPDLVSWLPPQWKPRICTSQSQCLHILPGGKTGLVMVTNKYRR